MYPTSARYREAVVGSHRAVVRVQALSSVQFGPAPTGGLDIPLRAGNVKLSSTSDVKGTLDVEVPGDYWDTLAPYGVELFCERGIDFGDGTRELVPLGYYRVERVEQALAPHGPVKVSGSDRIAQMKDARLVYPYAYPAGTTHRQLFDRMINGFTDGGKLISYGMYLTANVPIVWEGYNPDRAVLPAGVVEDSIYEHLAKIADAKACVLRFNRHGELVVERRDRAPGEASVYTVRPGETGNLISTSRKVDRSGVYNIVVARGSDPEAPTGYRLAYNDDETSPLRWYGPFGAIPRYYASPLLRTSDEADAAAETVLARYKGLPSGLSVITVPDPAVDPLDPITVVVGGVEQPHLSDEVTIPLMIGGNNPVEIVTRTLNTTPNPDETDPGTEPGGGTGGGGSTPPGDPDPGTPGGTPLFAAQFRDGVAFPWFTEPAGQQIVSVTNTSELTSKLAAAGPGQTLVLANGTYSPGSLTISRSGTGRDKPIVVRAATPGQAKLASGSSIRITGQWVLVKDLAKEFDDSGKTFSFEGAAKFSGFDGCLVGPTSLGAAQPSAAKSLHFYAGGDADQCFFTFCESRNKSKPGNGFLVDGNFSTFKACTHILIDHAYIHDYGTEVVNDFEAIRYGVSTMQTTQVNAAIIRCVFKNIATEPEIISLKACKIDSYGHTIENCVGVLSIRHGDDNFHRHCYVHGPATGARGTKAGGARVYGRRNDISECYFENLNGSSYESTLSIDGGDTSSPTNGHQNVDGGTFSKNLGVNCATAIVLGEHYSTAPKNITVKDNDFANCGGTAVRTVKAPTGTNDITNNQHFASVAAAGLTGPTGGAYRKTGRGPRLVRLSSADVGPGGNRADGTGASIGGSGGATTPPPTGGGGTTPPPGGTATSPGALLKIGPTPGYTFANIGVGFAAGDVPAGNPEGAPSGSGSPAEHIDYGMDRIAAGLVLPGYFEMSTDGKRVRATVTGRGGTTSSRTKYDRVEFRELNADGSKAAWNPTTSRGHVFYVFCRQRVLRMPPEKPELVLAQGHDASDDTIMIRMRNKTTVEAKLGDEILGNLTTSLVFGTDYDMMIKVTEQSGGKNRVEWFWGPAGNLGSAKFTRNDAGLGSGQYFKSLNYGQSRVVGFGEGALEDPDDAPLFITEMSKLVFWRTGYPEPLGL